MHPLDRINMQPKDRANGRAFLGTSLPLFLRPHRAPLALTLSGSVLSPAPLPPSRPVPSAQSADTPTFPCSPLKGSSPCLAGLGCLDQLPLPEDSLQRLKEKAERWGGASLTAGQSPHLVSTRRDQGAYPEAALPACTPFPSLFSPLLRLRGSHSHSRQARFGDGGEELWSQA